MERRADSRATEFQAGAPGGEVSGLKRGQRVRFGLGGCGIGRDGEVSAELANGWLIRDLADGRLYHVFGRSWIRTGPAPADAVERFKGAERQAEAQEQEAAPDRGEGHDQGESLAAGVDRERKRSES